MIFSDTLEHTKTFKYDIPQIILPLSRGDVGQVALVKRSQFHICWERNQGGFPQFPVIANLQKGLSIYDGAKATEMEKLSWVIQVGPV